MSEHQASDRALALQETSEIIIRNLEIDVPSQYKRMNLSYDMLKKMIANRIRQMLASEYEALLNLLYRIDVPEDKVAQALSEHHPKEAPDVLAGMIIERQLQKVITRQQYRK